MDMINSQQQQMNAVLSVNCVFVTALQRMYGPQFFAYVLKQLFSTFEESHAKSDTATLMNVLNCFLHLYLFQSITSDLLIGLIKILLTSFGESDIEILMFLMHNIGLQLRKTDPKSVMAVIDLFSR
jgi:hypothetical protein